MKVSSSRAIVISRLNYGEADRIITCLLEDGGKKALIAKGSRRLKSKLAGGIEPLAVNELSFAVSRGQLGIVTSARMIKNYANIKADLDRTQAAYKMIDWLKNYLEDDSGQEYFAYVLGALSLLDSSAKPIETAVVYFYVNSLRLSGQGIELTIDASGQPLDGTKNYRFDPNQMAFEVSSEGMYGSDHIKLLRLASTLEASRFATIKIPTDKVKDLHHLIVVILNTF